MDVVASEGCPLIASRGELPMHEGIAKALHFPDRLAGNSQETVYKGGDRGYPDRHTPGRSLPIRRRLPGGLVLAGRVTYDGAETGDGGGPWGTAGPPACFWHGVLRPPEEKAGRPEEAGTLPGMFDEERRSGRCPPRKAISD